MICVLFVGEGRGDIGREDAAHAEYRGDLVEITARILATCAAHPRAVQFESKIKYWHDHKLRGAKRRQTGQPRGFDAKLRRFLERQDIDAVVAVVDSADDPRGRLKQLQDGRRLAEQDNLPLSLRCAVGVAIQEIEAWLLADEDARCCGFGDDVGRRSLPSSPEDIADPKTTFAEFQGDCLTARPKEFDAHLIRRAIVDNMRIDVVARRCPAGFEPFKREIEERIGPLFGA